MRASKKAIKARERMYMIVLAILLLLGAYSAFKGTYKGYEETRIERYEHYTFVYLNGYPQETYVNSSVFNVPCDDHREDEQDCVIRGIRAMQAFRRLVNR